VKARGAVVNDFVLFVVGEGIEKKKDDFAAEVAAMTKA
jgi:elongation factor Ts